MDFLLIASSFFGYYKEIKLAIERRGRSVLWFEDRPETSNLSKALVRIHPSILKESAERYFVAIIREAQLHDIRDVLVIKGEALEPDVIRLMRLAMPKARFTLYFWDSYRNMPRNSAQKVALFDRAYSFDPLDVCKDSRLEYRPLFFLDEYAHLPLAETDIDVLFVGTVHTDRYKVLEKVARALPSTFRFRRLMYMPSSALFTLKQLALPSYWGARRGDFIFTPLTKDEVLKLLTRSRIVIDIERAVQHGFTIRTVEMLGASKKTITTNQYILSADFYRPENQLVVDRENPKIPRRFLEAAWSTLPAELLQLYTLESWLSEVLQ